MDARAEKMRQRFEERQKARVAQLKHKKEGSSAKASQAGKAEAFTKAFSEEMTQLMEMFSELNDGLGRSELVAKFEEIMQNLKKTQKLLTDSVMFLPDFEVKNAQATLQKLQTDVNLKHDELLPRKKFGFKTRTKNVPQTTETDEAVKKGKNEANDNKEQIEAEKSKTYIDDKDSGFDNKSDCELSMSSDDCKQKDIKLSNLQNCTVKIYGGPSALHINNLKNCQIFSGPIRTASFVSDCTNCHFSLACQQVRIHTTKDSIFNIHVTGKAIIEDCTNVGFAPYNWLYQNLSDDFEEIGLRTDVNKWDDIDDFNWLTSDEPSPNWYKVPEESRQTVEELG